MNDTEAPVPVSKQLTGWKLYSLGLALGIANLMMALDASVMGTLIQSSNLSSCDELV